MKTPVAVTLIICGTVLIALPFVSAAGVLKQLALTMLAGRGAVGSVAGVPQYADIICMAGGAIMILLGILGGVRSEKKTEP